MSPEEQKNSTCPDCGAPNEIEALECNTCGTDLSHVPEALEPEQVGPAPEHAPAAPRQAPRTLDYRDYLIFILGGAVVTLLIFIFSTPEEKTAPPQPAMTQQGQTVPGGLPPGHPPTEATGPTERQIALEKELREKLEETPGDTELRLRYANLLYDMDRHDMAASHYRQYLKEKPDDPDARTDLAYSIFRSGDLEGAIEQLRRVVGKKPEHQPALYNLAIMHMNLDNPDSVLYYLDRVAAIDPNSTMGRNATSILNEYRKSHPPGNEH